MKEQELREQFAAKDITQQVFSQEELEMIACGFKSQMQVTRKAIKNVEILQKKSKFENKKSILEQYRLGLVKNLMDTSNKQLSIIDDHCIAVTGSPVPLIFFNKLKADIFRYNAEVTIGA